MLPNMWSNDIYTSCWHWAIFTFQVVKFTFTGTRSVCHERSRLTSFRWCLYQWFDYVIDIIALLKCIVAQQEIVFIPENSNVWKIMVYGGLWSTVACGQGMLRYATVLAGWQDCVTIIQDRILESNAPRTRSGSRNGTDTCRMHRGGDTVSVHATRTLQCCYVRSWYKVIDHPVVTRTTWRTEWK